jgi:hypothetical protein
MKPLADCFSIGTRVLGVAVACMLQAGVSHADIVTLSDNGSEATVNLGSSAGMSAWTVTGLPAGYENQLNQQWFWFRVGNGLAAPINDISAATYFLTGNNQLSATYANADVSVTIKYKLTGGGIGQADISEGITIQNLHPLTPMDFHFYQYSDFNLLNSGAGDSINLLSDYVVQWKGDTQIAESIVAPEASHFEANVVGASDSTLAKFASTPGLVLDDSKTEVYNADVTWAFQWDYMNLTTESIAKDKLISITFVPEPSIAALMGVGVLLLLRRRSKV